ncbi:MAG: c-type cytochrome biogenesis protein CcmI [Rhodospirillaceae bacterium]
MTLFWILAAALTAAVVATLVRPVLRPGAPPPTRAAWNLEVYRDQLAEIGRDLGRGVIEAAQAEAARTEISRRILAADSAPARPPRPARPNRITVLVLIAGMPLAALTLYLTLGHPGLPARPFAERAAEAARPEAVPQTVLDAVSHLAERLKAEPNNLEGWTLLAQSYGKLERLPEAVEAWRRAAALAPDDPDLSGALAEALTRANQGLVPDEARRLFEAVLIRSAHEPRASHYLALARFQAGDDQGALEGWAGLVAASPEDAPWLPLVRQRIAEVAGRLKLDAASVTPKALPPRGPGPGAAADRGPAIAAMVEGLRVKLEADPADIEGWLRLIRAYEVLGDGAKRLEAARHARAAAPRRPEVLVALAEAVIAAAPAAGPANRLPAEAEAALREALAIAPATPAALWYLGLDAAQAGKAPEARPLLETLLRQLDPAGPDYTAVKARLDSLK